MDPTLTFYVRGTVLFITQLLQITEDDLSSAISEFLVNNNWNSTEITTVKICRTKSGVSKGLVATFALSSSHYSAEMSITRCQEFVLLVKFS